MDAHDHMPSREPIDVMPVALVAVLALLIGFVPIPWDPDLWFHLASGNHILSSGSVPQADPFSFTRQGELWVPHSWLFDVATSLVWHHLGPRTLEAFMAVAFMGAIAVSFALLTGRGVAPPAALAICLALAVAAGNTRGVRPQVFSLLLANVVILLLIRHRERPGWRLLILLPASFLVWSQLHGAVVMGLGVAAAWLAGRLIDAFAARSLRAHARELVVGAAAWVGAALAILVTPHRITLYEYLRLTMDLSALKQTAEWQAPRLWPPEVPDIYACILVVGLAALLVWRVRRAARVSFAELGLCIVLVALAMTGVRHIPLAWIGAMPLVASTLAPDPHYTPGRVRMPGRIPWLAGAVSLVLLAAMWRYPTAVTSRYAAAEPVRGAAALAKLDRPLRVFTTYNTGSYVLFAHPGRAQVFVDSRADVYGDAICEQALRASAGRDWQPLFDAWQIDAVVVQRHDPLAGILGQQPDWVLLAEDPAAVTFVRSRPPADRYGS